MPFSQKLAVFGFLTIYLSLSSTVFGQVNPYVLPKMRYEPIMPTHPSDQSSLQPHSQQATVGQEIASEVIIPNLQGFIVLDSISDVKLISPATSGVQIDTHRQLALARNNSIQRVLSQYLGRSISFADIQQIQKDITELHQQSDMPVVGVVIPNQDPESGTLQIVILEGRIRNVFFQGNRYFETQEMYDRIYARPGQRIYESILNEDIRTLNQSAFRNVTLDLDSFDENGYSDIRFRVEDDFPIRASAGYTDNGTRTTGIERLQFGVTHGNLWKKEHVGNYTYLATPDFKSVQVHSASYMIPLKNRDIISVYGYHGKVIPDYGNLPFSGEGKTWQTSLRYSKLLGLHPKQSSRREQRFSIGFDFKETNSNLDFGGIVVSRTAAQVAQLEFGYSDTFIYKSGYIGFNTELFWSPGGFSKHNNSESFRNLRLGADAEYVYATMDINTARYLNSKWQWNLNVRGQWSDSNLLPIEMQGLGGEGTIRGYDMYTENADSGWVVSNELATRWKSIGLNKTFRKVPPYRCVRQVEDEFQFYGFFDIGGGWKHSPIPNYDWDYEYMSSTGIGCRYNFGPWIRLSACYGWQLRDIEGDDSSSDGRPHISLVISR